MNPTDKLPPLREALERIAWRDTPIHPRGPDDFTVYLPRHVVLGIGDRHDALIRQQEARIAELEQQASEVAEHVFCGWTSQEYCESYRKLYVMLGGPDVETIPQAKSAARIAELEKERETFRKGFSIANDQAEHVTSLFLPVEAELEKFRALAKRAAELGQRVELADNLNADQILDELAAMHQED